MRHAPKETVDSWIRQPALSPRRLIPAILQQHRRSEPMSSNHAVRYLSHVIHRQSCTDTTIYNLLLTFYAADPDPDDGPLIRFLSSCPDDPETERPYYDLDYALRTCKQHGRIQPCVLIYSKLGLYESSVDLALEKGDLELAKENADKPEDDDVLRKKLWLKIAKYVVQEQKDIKRWVIAFPVYVFPTKKTKAPCSSLDQPTYSRLKISYPFFQTSSLLTISRSRSVQLWKSTLLASMLSRLKWTTPSPLQSLSNATSATWLSASSLLSDLINVGCAD